MNITPKTIRPLAALAARGLSGVEELGAELEINRNPAAAIAAERDDLLGRPADPDATPPVAAIPGKHPLYLEARVEHAGARADLRQALADGSALLGQAVDTLKPVLGRRWNTSWNAVGFSSGSLSVPRNPTLLLPLLAAYYRTHPAQESAALNLTAVKADEAAAAIDTAQTAVDAARTAETTAKQARDAALKILRERIMRLRHELEALLAPDDARWYRFGFRRPVDGNTPDLIDEVRLTPAGAGQVFAEWSRSRLSENFRVSWKPANAAPEVEPTEVGLYQDQQALITGLPSGVIITVGVTARNEFGESAPAEADIVVP